MYDFIDDLLIEDWFIPSFVIAVRLAAFDGEPEVATEAFNKAMDDTAVITSALMTYSLNNHLARFASSSSDYEANQALIQRAVQQLLKDLGDVPIEEAIDLQRRVVGEIMQGRSENSSDSETLAQSSSQMYGDFWRED